MNALVKSLSVKDRDFWCTKSIEKVSTPLFWGFGYCGTATYFYITKKKKNYNIKTTIYISEILQVSLIEYMNTIGRRSLEGFGPKYNLCKK